MTLPYFLFTFANDRRGALLRGIAQEQDAIREALALRSHQCKLEVIADIDADTLIGKLSHNTPAIFHYGGHADESGLRFDRTEGVESQQLSGFLQHFNGIQLIFLNGCATYDQAQDFLDAGVKHVIVTHTSIADSAATIFAHELYAALARGAQVPDAFSQAENATLVRLGHSPVQERGLVIWRDDAAVETGLPWHLESSPEGKRDPWKWEEPTERAWGTVVKGHKDGPGLNEVVIRKGRSVVTSTDESGGFDIILRQQWVGKKVEIDVQKPAFEVVNPEALTLFIESGRNPEEAITTIIMCPEGHRQQFASLHYNIVLREGLDTGTLEEEEQAAAQLEQIVQILKDVDTRHAPDYYLRAVQHLGKGEVRSAIKELDESELKAELSRAKAQRERGEKRIQRITDAYLLKAAAYTLGLRFDQVERCYEKAIEADPANNEAWQAYCDYLYKQNELQKAGKLCAQRAEYVKGQKNSAVHDESFTSHNFGRLAMRQGALVSAKRHFERALDLRQSLVDDMLRHPGQSPEAMTVYRASLAATHNNYGKVLLELQEFEEAHRHLNESLEIDRKLSEENPAYRRYMAICLNDLGDVYTAWESFDKAQYCYDDALVLSRELAEQNSYEYSPGLARTYNNLGRLYLLKSMYNEATGAYHQALKILEDLVDKNPRAYAPVLAATLHDEGVLHRVNKAVDTAMDVLARALEMRTALYQGNPAAYGYDFAATHSEIGRLLLKRRDYASAMSHFEQAIAALNDQRRLRENVSEIAGTRLLFNIAETHFYLGDQGAAQEYLTKARILAQDLHAQLGTSFDEELTTATQLLDLLTAATEEE